MTAVSSLPAAEQAEQAAAAVRACPAVADLSGGGGVQIATYLPGRRVVGVRLGEDRVTVAVIAVLGVPLFTVAEQVRAAVAPWAGGRRVDVQIDDVTAASPTASSPTAPAPAASADAAGTAATPMAAQSTTALDAPVGPSGLRPDPAEHP